MVQFLNNTTPSYERLALFDSVTNSSTYSQFASYSNAKSMVFAGGASEIARDGISILVGDALTPTTDGSILTLAFMIGLVSCWSALILIEQVMYAAEKQQRWWPWALACALTQGDDSLRPLSVCSCLTG
jgi:hypothetical protein